MKMKFTDNPLSTRAGVQTFEIPRGQSPVWPTAEQVVEAPVVNKIDWLGYWRSINKSRWWILAATVVMTALAVVYAQSINPVYRSTTTLLIESGKTKILSIDEVYNAVSQDREYYQTQVEILRSRDVALRTVADTKLWDEPEFDPRRPVQNLQSRIREFLNPPPPPAPWTPERLAEETVGKFLGALTIEPVRLSQLVKISFESHDPKLAAKMADATAISFNESDRDNRLKLSLSVTGQLQERLVALREKLVQSEQDLQKFRESTGLVSVSGSQGVAGQQLSEIGQRLITARVRRTELESDYQQVARTDGGDYNSVSAVISQPGVGQARQRVAEASVRLEELVRTLGEEHPKVVEARTSLLGAQRELKAQTRAVVVSMKAQVQAARETERVLEAALGSARTAVQGVNRQEFELNVLEREVQTNKQLYDLLLNRTKETSVSTNLQAAVARIVDKASPSAAPVRPNKPQIVMLTMVLMLTLGASAAILKDKFNDTVQGTDEAEHRLHYPVLAALPEVHHPGTHGMTRQYLDAPKSRHAESIRAARTSMLMAKLPILHKLILVTSALSGEGKTTFCTNLAFAHAQTKRTLLIDCDLRNPQIGARLGLPADAKGITNLVIGTAALKECVHAVKGSRLLLVPAGDLPEHPEEFLLSPSFRDALQSLANRVDVVLIDSPPLAVCSDALIIAQQVNDTIYVVKARDTPHLLAQRGLQRLRQAGASILGLVLNNMDSPGGDGSAERPTYPEAYGKQRPVAEGTVISE
jgi:capsular exopolysaccharide synthesis family protein